MYNAPVYPPPCGPLCPGCEICCVLVVSGEDIPPEKLFTGARTTPIYNQRSEPQKKILEPEKNPQNESKNVFKHTPKLSSSDESVQPSNNGGKLYFDSKKRWQKRGRGKRKAENIDKVERDPTKMMELCLEMIDEIKATREELAGAISRSRNDHRVCRSTSVIHVACNIPSRTCINNAASSAEGSVKFGHAEFFDPHVVRSSNIICKQPISCRGRRRPLFRKRRNCCGKCGRKRCICSRIHENCTCKPVVCGSHSAHNCPGRSHGSCRSIFRGLIPCCLGKPACRRKPCCVQQCDDRRGYGSSCCLPPSCDSPRKCRRPQQTLCCFPRT